MAEMYAVPEKTLSDIADAIRLKRDITTPLTVDDMALEIGMIEGGGLPVWWEGEINVPAEMTANGTIATVNVEQMATANGTQFLLVVAEPEDKNFGSNDVQWTVGFLGHGNAAAFANSGYQYYRKGLSGAMSNYGVYVSASSKANRTMTFSASASTSRVIKAGKWHITIYDLITMPAIY